MTTGLSCGPAGAPLEDAPRHDCRAGKALRRGNPAMHAWVTRCDPVTALLPRRRDDPNRVVRDSAAEPYPLLVPASYFTQRPLDESVMREILRRQVRQAALVGRLADDMAPGARGFLHREIETDRIIFRSGGYAKEGLTALTKRPGEMPSYFEVVRPCRRHPRSRPLPVAAPGALRGDRRGERQHASGACAPVPEVGKRASAGPGRRLRRFLFP